MSLRHRSEAGLFALATAAVRALPLGFAYWLAALLARGVFLYGGKRVRWTLANLRIAFPELSEQQRVIIGRDSYSHFAWNLVDFAISERWTDDEVRARVSITGLEHICEPLEQARGVLVLTLHLGNFELGARAGSLALEKFRPAAVSRPMRNPILYDRLTRSHAGGATELIHRTGAAPRILRALGEGRPVGVLIDQYSRRARGVLVPFFGVRCQTSAGIATLALRSRAPVVPFFVVREGPLRHSAYFLPPVDTRRSGDLREDIRAATAGYNAALEGLIRRYPAQWMWGHRRFRHSPDLSYDPYAAGS